MAQALYRKVTALLLSYLRHGTVVFFVVAAGGFVCLWTESNVHFHFDLFV